MMKKLLFVLVLTSVLSAKAQDKVNAGFCEGIVAAGYVNEGGYLNFTGPNVNATFGESKFFLGMLPSLRFKDDKGATRNSFVFPTLGFGLTYSYKALALQVPFYYNAKTSTENGKWNVGIGIGLRLNKIYPNKNSHEKP